MRSTSALLTIALPLLVGPMVVHAEDPIELSPRHTRVALFKNGLALVETRVDLGELDGERAFRVTPLPPARFGSLWIAWPEGLAVEGIRSARVRGEERLPAMDIGGLLRASVGERLAVWVGNEWIEGELLPIPKVEPEPPQPATPRDGWRSAIPPQRGPDLVMLRQTDGTIAVPMNMITRVRLGSEATTEGLTITSPTWVDALLFRASPGDAEKAPAAGREVTLQYLVQGLTWSPSYVVELTGEETARLSAKAIIVNDFADLDRVSAELVAGFPHTPPAATEEAIALTPMEAWMQQLRTAVGFDLDPSNRAVGYLAQGRLRAAEPNAPVATMPLTPAAGEASEDLFFFRIEDLTVGRNERLYHPMFAVDVPYAHCYTWEIPDYIDEQRGYQEQPADAEQVVWHALRLTNTTEQPWTTAPGLTMKSGRVLGQDTLHYTPSGAKTDLRITQAVNLKADQTEHEVERQRQAERFFGYHYDRVTVEGELSLRNFGNESARVQVTKTLSGELEARSEEDGERGPTVVKLARGLRRVNPTSRLTWEVDVPVGDAGVKLPYRYTVYVRN